MRLLATALCACLVAALAGCGPKVAQDTGVSIVLKETTGTKPIRMTVKVDGENIFGPRATLSGGETKTFKVNAPPEQLQKTGQHTILYTFDRTGLLGTIGEADIQVRAGDDLIFEDDSNKVLSGWMPTYSFRYVITSAKK